MSNTWFRLRRGFFLSFFPSDTPHYENVPFEVPSSWVWCRLDDIVSFQGGYAYKSNTYVNQSDWQVIRIGNVKNDNLILDIQPVFVEDVIGKTTEKYLLKKDDILFTMTGTKGKRDYFYTAKVPSIKKNLLLNQRVGCLRCFSSEINIDFLCLVLKGEYVLDAIFSTETGNVSQGNIGSESTLNLNIAIPPLTEQHRIVVEIEKWFALIDQIEQGKSDLQSTIKQTKSKILDLAIHGKLVPQDPNDEPASELLKRINPNFTPCDNGHYTQLPEGWAICKMKQITSITNGKSQKNVETLNGIYPIYGSGGVIGRANQYLCIAGSTIIGRKGTINNPIFVEEHFWNVDTAFGLKANDAILDKYLYYFCLSFDFSKLDKSTAMPSLTKTSIGNVLIPIPPYKEQERIVAKIDMVLDTMNEILRAV